jgi:hypothetical protein
MNAKPRSTAELASAASGAGMALEDERRQDMVDSRPHDESGQLLDNKHTAEFRSRWDSIQAGFVDEPRKSVEQADQLIVDAIKKLAETFAAERDRLEKQWGRGDNVSTEDLRVALQKYRSFFNRLLSL